ncbi:NAD(P)-binding domain superfamily [Arabidopsis thaliana x Arabidopsis arenosa]|uniref:NAD(P)-binding domain superfamily n=1 Tax=Arabidopsis thaliana x Arabidopsis arenosa TaxID=1240361 RepID=A0A8T2A1S0_9BRAS|nr:NAD(P)-binding domain superfamily [Arabidopsis thaliana x Arabidopsis arenosa]
MNQEKPISYCCVLDASTYVGFWILKRLLTRGYSVHAAIRKNEDSVLEEEIRDMEAKEERLEVYDVDVLDYQSILISLNNCNAVFCCLDNPEGYDEEKEVDLEVRGAINVVEACARTESIEKIVFSSSLTAAIWTDNIGTQKDVDEKCWSDLDFCLKKKMWHALAKMQSEKAAWALAMDRMVNMVSVNPGLIVGPSVAQHNSRPTMSYLKGAAQMYENGVLAYVDVEFVADVHIRAFEDTSACGRYFCFNQIVNTEEEALKLVQTLSPLIPMPPRYEKEMQGSEVYEERLRNKKLNKLVEAGFAC